MLTFNDDFDDCFFIFLHHIDHMRITIDIDENILADAMRLTGETKKGPAVVKAAQEYIRREMAREFGRKLMDGDFGDYPMTNAEIEALDR